MAHPLFVLETPQEMHAVEELQRIVWPGDEMEIVPAHLLITAVHNGGILIGAFDTGKSESKGLEIQNFTQSPPQDAPLIGFVFGFPGFYPTADGPRLKHCSHMLGVHPDFRDQNIGFKLKRAQWQMVRHQGIDRVTWTYDPLQSRNAHLNIARLGTVCNTYLRDAYGPMRDGLNIGMPSDRFQVDWWVNTQRVARRLSKHPRRSLDLAHYLAAEVRILNPTFLGNNGLVHPGQATLPHEDEHPSLLLVEIPAEFPALKTSSLPLAKEWQLHIRQIFENTFAQGYLVTDFIYLQGSQPRSYYVLSYGEATL